MINKMIELPLEKYIQPEEENLKFYAFNLHNINKEDIKNIKKRREDKDCLEFKSDNTRYYYNVDYYAPEENLIVLEFKYSNNDAYSNTVYNSNTQEVENNPREPEQKELNKQFFVVLQIHGEKRYTIHVSSTQRVKFANSFFVNVCKNPQVKIDKVFLDLDKLIEKTSTVKKIGLNASSSGELFNQEYKAIADKFSNSQYDVLLNIEGTINPNDLKDFKKSNGSVGIASLSGTDKEGFDYFFNLKSFSKTFEVDVSKKENNLYSITDIYREARRYLIGVLNNA